ncbi:MAG: bifunctional phosphoglucose/phosphomannose isomerase [Chloroflexota bacterium]|jgi:glucose/mannose-6-phosphate isomerase
MTQPGTANILDDAAAMARIDSEDMLGRVAALPGQVAEGWRISRGLELPWARPSSVAVLGMGGSAIGGDLVKGIWTDRITVPVEVLRGYELPAWIGPETLVIASSKSGQTEETLRQLETALARRCPVVCVTSGGVLGNVARAAGLPLAVIPAGGAPRASIGWSMGIVAGILERAGVLTLEAPEIDAGVASGMATGARCAASVPTTENPAKQLAWSLVDRFVMVGGSGFLAPVARRWKSQLNENGKATAIFEELPEATHNTVVGFEQPESLRDHLAIVLLGSTLDHPRDTLRAQLVGDLLETGHIWHTFVEVEGEGPLGHALSAMLMGDYVSVYLAFMYAIDPTPVDVISYIKEQLALADQADAE